MTAWSTGCPEVLLGRLLQLLQHHRGDLRRRRTSLSLLTRTSPLLARDTLIRAPSSFLRSPRRSLRPMKRLIEKIVFSGLRDRLPLGNLPDERARRLGEPDHRRREPAAFSGW
jgi:hypothetical protein